MTEYIILRARTGENPNTWEEISPGATIQASSARRALAGLDLKSGEYVALPARSWKTLTVKTETVTKTTIG